MFCPSAPATWQGLPAEQPGLASGLLWLKLVYVSPCPKGYSTGTCTHQGLINFPRMDISPPLEGFLIFP